MITRKEFQESILKNPLIVAISDEKTYEFAIKSNYKVVFLLDSTVSNLRDRVEGLLKRDKIVFIHIDMVSGLNSTTAVVDFIGDLFCNKVGIITSKHNLIRRANERGIRSVYRGLIVDSKSKKIFKINLKSKIYPDAVEILPAFVTNVIEEIVEEFPDLFIIAGGLVKRKKEAYKILNSGASAVSTSSLDLLKE